MREEWSPGCCVPAAVHAPLQGRSWQARPLLRHAALRRPPPSLPPQKERPAALSSTATAGAALLVLMWEVGGARATTCVRSRSDQWRGAQARLARSLPAKAPSSLGVRRVGGGGVPDPHARMRRAFLAALPGSVPGPCHLPATCPPAVCHPHATLLPLTPSEPA